MYGLVIKAIEGMVLKNCEASVWEAIKIKAEVKENTFLSMQYYPDHIVYDLVNAASDILNIPGEELLRQFGRHWILFTAKEGYGPLLNAAGATVQECIMNLDSIHARIAYTMPELKPPSFQCLEHSFHHFEVRYFSDREGLAPMVIGLLEGLGEMFGTPLLVAHMNTDESLAYQSFDVKYAPPVSI